MDEQEIATEHQGFSGAQLILFVMVAILLTTGLCFWLFKTFISNSDFKPVELSAKEQVQLDSKLRLLGLNPGDLLPSANREEPFGSDGRLEPEQYRENLKKRDIRMSERELNAVLASNPDLAKRFAIDLSKDLASAKLLIPIDPGMPVMGGRTLRVSAGLELAYREDQPIVMLRGVSIMGVPVPNAWLGNLKNVDLFHQFGSEPGFWSSFGAGIALIEVEDGQLHIVLKE